MDRIRQIVIRIDKKQIEHYYTNMNRFSHLTAVVFIAVLSLFIYANTLKNGFVYDDELTIINNSLIKNLSNLPQLFEGKSYFALSGEMTYRPIVTMTYFIDYSMYGLKPWGFHCTNILLHAANAVLLYIFLIQLTQPHPNPIYSKKSLIQHLSINPAFLAAILFVVHPVLTEAVNGVSFREDLLVFFFYFISLIYYLKAAVSKPVCYLTSYFFFLLALLSKEMAVTLPLTIVLIDIYKGVAFKRPWRYIGFVLVVSLYSYIRFFMFYNSIEFQDVETAAFSDRLLQVPALIGQHFRLLLLPINLSIEYQNQINFGWIYIFGLLIIILEISVFIIATKKANIYIFGLLWIVITLIPVYNIVPIDNAFAERYLYLPLPGFSIVVVSLINSQSRYHKTLLVSLLLSSFIFLVISRNPVWQDDYHLWGDSVKKVSTHRAYLKFGKASSEKGMLSDAINFYLKALSIEPYNSDTYINLGIAYFEQGNVDLAIANFKKSLWMKYDDATAHYLLGRSYVKKGLIEEAKLEYKEALNLDPGFIPATEALRGLIKFN